MIPELYIFQILLSHTSTISTNTQHTRVPLAEERSADNWADPGEAELALQAVVEQIFSDVSAMCLGRFGQHILAATTDGEVGNGFRVYLIAPR